MDRVAGKRILVTAAGSGIGRACAEMFAHQGAHVYAADIDSGAIGSLTHERISAITLDGTDASAVPPMLERLPVLDALVHCIGFVHQGTILQCDAAHWRQSFLVNVDSFYLALQAVLPPMIESKRGSIVCISSVASSIKGLPDRAAYGATKGALLGLVKSVAADYVGLGIRCNAVCPGTVTSPSLEGRIEQLGREIGNAEEARARYVSRQPMKRLGTPEEVAALCLYLVSDESRFVTGQAFAIDGGITI